ncbi:unnamed protein product [Oppiella nova]|uniref:Uncharacterized protein n=1 Tax=Oppiella nova TaxID=334625 RepID=A0A7R9QV75_9ACAR|nr:unnamed protein product [Oppiella nova]CAG2176261.1 unnamed protein product [Oppiella nova]
MQQSYLISVLLCLAVATVQALPTILPTALPTILPTALPTINPGHEGLKCMGKMELNVTECIANVLLPDNLTSHEQIDCCVSWIKYDCQLIFAPEVCYCDNPPLLPTLPPIIPPLPPIDPDQDAYLCFTQISTSLVECAAKVEVPHNNQVQFDCCESWVKFDCNVQLAKEECTQNQYLEVQKLVSQGIANLDKAQCSEYPYTNKTEICAAPTPTTNAPIASTTGAPVVTEDPDDGTQVIEKLVIKNVVIESLTIEGTGGGVALTGLNGIDLDALAAKLKEILNKK